jgi:maltose O-acetyltransferase
VSFKLFIANTLTRVLPPTRAYRWKRYVYRTAGIDVDDGVRIVSSVTFLGQCSFSIGRDTFVGWGTLIIGGGESRIRIGQCVDIGPRVTILAGTHEIDMNGTHAAGPGVSRDILIGNGAWLGGGSVLLPGVSIGEMAVIGAGSVVVRDIPPYTIAVGNPCRPIRQWDQDSESWIEQTREGHGT